MNVGVGVGRDAVLHVALPVAVALAADEDDVKAALVRVENIDIGINATKDITSSNRNEKVGIDLLSFVPTPNSQLATTLACRKNQLQNRQ